MFRSAARLHPLALTTLAAIAPAALLHGQTLTPTTSQAGDYYGNTTTVSGDLGLVNAPYADPSSYTDAGELYLFRALDASTASNTAVARLRPSTGYGNYLYFGSSLSASGNGVLIGGGTGAWLFRSLDSASGLVNETATLTVPNANAAPADVPYAVSLSGSTGLVGAYANNDFRGQVFVYHGLDTATGAATASATLAPTTTLSNGNPNTIWPFGSTFGATVSLSGGTAVVGAPTHNDADGLAFLFRGVDTASGTVNQSATLTTSAPLTSSQFGGAISVSGNMAVVGARYATVSGATGAGLAYLYRNLDTATGTVTESAILSSSTPISGLNFGSTVALSGDNALITHATLRGAGLYTGLGTATGTVTERLVITPSDGSTVNSASLDGDRFLLGAYNSGSLAGSAFSGSVSALTTLDTGNTSHLLNRYSVEMQSGDWIVGATTSHNTVTLAASSQSGIPESQMVLNDPASAVYIGRDAGSNDNLISLQADSQIFAHQIYVGSIAGNSGNTLRLESISAGISSTPTNHNLALYLAPGNDLQLLGDYSIASSFFNILHGPVRDADLLAWNGTSWNLLNAGNYSALLTLSYDGTYTIASAIPEPCTFAALAGLALLAHTATRRRRRA